MHSNIELIDIGQFGLVVTYHQVGDLDKSTLA